MNIYIVMGKTGEYGDRNERSVIAYFDEAKAKEHVVNADRRAKEIQATREDYYYNTEPGANEFDPNMSMEFTGTDYYYNTVPLCDN